MNKKTFWKILILVVVGAYIISPIDALPALPFDDLLVLILGILGEAKLFKKPKEKDDTNISDEKDIVDSEIVE